MFWARVEASSAGNDARRRKYQQLLEANVKLDQKPEAEERMRSTTGE